MILLIDDDRNNLLIIGKFLEHLGFEYHTAENGKEGIDLFCKNDYKIVLLDIQMPEMNGIECAQAIRKLGHNKNNVPIVALTSQIFREELNKYLLAGINDYLIKPFDPSELNGVLIKYYVSNDRAAIVGHNINKEENKYEIIKLDYIKRLANGEEKFVKEMLATISEDVPIYIEKLEASYEEKNVAQIKRIAHKLNSPFGTIDLNSLHVINFFNNSNEKDILSSKGFEALTELKNIANKALIEIKKELNSKLN